MKEIAIKLHIYVEKYKDKDDAVEKVVKVLSKAKFSYQLHEAYEQGE